MSVQAVGVATWRSVLRREVSRWRPCLEPVAKQGASWSDCFLDPLGTKREPPVPTIGLPPALSKLLTYSAAHAIPTEAKPNHLVIADMGATDHMIPHQSSFVSYHRVTNLWVRMANAGYAPVLGRGTAVISLNDKRVLVREALHVPSL